LLNNSKEFSRYSIEFSFKIVLFFFFIDFLINMTDFFITAIVIGNEHCDDDIQYIIIILQNDDFFSIWIDTQWLCAFPNKTPSS